MSTITTRIIDDADADADSDFLDLRFYSHCVPIRNRGFVPVFRHRHTRGWYYYRPGGKPTPVTTEKFQQMTRKPYRSLNLEGVPGNAGEDAECSGSNCYCGLGRIQR